ncbi:MAG: hypothetical protein AB1515_02980 [Nitrospirota bacterium]
MRTRFRGFRWLLPALLIPALGGCGEGATVLLHALLNLSGASLTSGDGGTDGWPDTTSDNTSLATNVLLKGFAMGLKSAKLTGPNGESFTLFTVDDTDPCTSAPCFIRLHEGLERNISVNGDDLGDGTYDTLVLEVLFYEAAVDVYSVNTANTRRFRVYLADFTETLPATDLSVQAQDLLMSDDDFTVPGSGDDPVGGDGTDLQWIDPTDGSLCAVRNTCNAGAPYQVSASQFAGYTDGIVNLGLDQEIVVDSDTDANFTIELTAGTNGLFFYDETDGATANENARFNLLSPLGADPENTDGESKDGKIEDACDPTDCLGAEQTADFWFGAPGLTVTVKN